MPSSPQPCKMPPEYSGVGVVATYLGKCVPETIGYQSPSPHNLTLFDSCERPVISIEDYVRRMGRGLEHLVSSNAFKIAVVLLTRILEKENPVAPLTHFNVHRLFATALLIAAKFLEDDPLHNSQFCRASGIGLRELNKLERVFLKYILYDIHVSASDMGRLFGESASGDGEMETREARPVRGTRRLVGSRFAKPSPYFRSV